MAQNVLRSTARLCPRRCTLLGSKAASRHCAAFSTSTAHWIRRFLSPGEENELYLGITSAFRQKLDQKSKTNAHFYSNIIEDVLFSAEPKRSVSVERLKEFKQAIDLAGKNKDVAELDRLAQDMGNDFPVTMFNRLIRAYIACDALSSAERVLEDLLPRKRLLPTTRSFIYLIAVYVQRDQLDNARHYVEEMQHLGLARIRSPFDFHVMLNFYTAAGDTHAIDFLWHDMLQIQDLKSGTALYRHFGECFLRTKQTDQLAKVVKEVLARELAPQQQDLATFVSMAMALAPNHPQQAEGLVLHMFKTSGDIPADTVRQVMHSYLVQDQSLRALMFHYRLCKLDVLDSELKEELTRLTEHALDSVERRPADEEEEQMMTEFGLLAALK
ncbi:hypothetical protein DFQ28_011296 [Apophysomyces sp. BC1034]|nr:hypothetical protein DFQ30_011026 [Apophysomyces sp. BC1015]KAG0168940.1 hypothetical protein DFQ29_009968 [Apophysomyces sp. BC1021]KAG0184381.1 hypothetical protein DFQ28_011296 [Apophysomyces sp. BC1034]